MENAIHVEVGMIVRTLIDLPKGPPIGSCVEVIGWNSEKKTVDVRDALKFTYRDLDIDMFMSVDGMKLSVDAITIEPTIDLDHIEEMMTEALDIPGARPALSNGLIAIRWLRARIKEDD